MTRLTGHVRSRLLLHTLNQNLHSKTRRSLPLTVHIVQSLEGEPVGTWDIAGYDQLSVALIKLFLYSLASYITEPGVRHDLEYATSEDACLCQSVVVAFWLGCLGVCQPDPCAT